MAKHAKKLLGSIQPKLGTLEKANGKSTDVGEDTFQELMDVHYPSHTTAKETQYNTENTISLEVLMGRYKEWINVDLIRSALCGFKSKKSPGPDEIRRIIFPHLTNNILEQLCIIYKACIALRFTPTLWKEAKVIFIPKPGKEQYNKAKSFRPISLSNYFLKGLEKLCVWRVDIELIKKPIHCNQHGFQKGKSTETAISKTVNTIEKYLDNKQFCVGVFLDIQGAFDTICPKYIKKCLQEHVQTEDLIEWYYNYLTHRNLKSGGRGIQWRSVSRNRLPPRRGMFS